MIKELLEKEQARDLLLRYKRSHRWGYLCTLVSVAAAITATVLLSFGAPRLYGTGLVLLAAAGLMVAGYLLAMRAVQRRLLEHPEQRTGAKHPARIRITARKYRELRAHVASSALERKELDRYSCFLADLLMNGELQPAVVISTEPFVVAVYSDEFDGTLLLSLPETLAEELPLEKGARTVAAVSYYETPFSGLGLQKDIFPGPAQTGRWTDLLPVLPVLLTEDEALLREKADELDPALWDRALLRIRQHCEDFPDRVRNAFWYILDQEE